MKIVIHGTFGGYKTITPEKEAGLFDVRPDPCREKTVGQGAYSIHFYGSSVIFSKYKIIRDGIGDLRTGNIAFSVIIPNTQKLQGGHIKEMLDKLEESFFVKNHIKDDNILSSIGRDWAFITEIKNFYESKVRGIPALTCRQGSNDAAYVFYSSDDDLQKYLDMPGRNEYCAYKQIFFVRQELKDKPENPLNALRHSENDLTSEIEPFLAITPAETAAIAPEDEMENAAAGDTQRAEDESFGTPRPMKSMAFSGRGKTAKNTRRTKIKRYFAFFRSGRGLIVSGVLFVVFLSLAAFLIIAKKAAINEAERNSIDSTDSASLKDTSLSYGSLQQISNDTIDSKADTNKISVLDSDSIALTDSTRESLHKTLSDSSHIGTQDSNVTRSQEHQNDKEDKK